MSLYRMSARTQRARSFHALRRYLRTTVAPYHPFYRRRFREIGFDPRRVRTYDDFRRLPLTTKEEVRADPRAFVLQPRFPGRGEAGPYDTARISTGHLLRYLWEALLDRPRDPARLFRRMGLADRIARRASLDWVPVHFHASGGSTGEPTPAVYTFRDIHEVIPEVAAQVWLEPDVVDPGRPRQHFWSRSMSLFPGTPHLAFFQAVIAKFFTGFSVFDTCGGRVIPTERAIRIFARGGFEAIGAVPSYLVHWMRRAVEMRAQGEIPGLASLGTAVVGAEPVTPALRKELKALAGRLGAHPGFRVIEGYGMTEMRWAFTECDEGTGVHLNPRYWFWEILDPTTHEPVGPGCPGILVVSHVGWHGTVLIRYNTGDLVHGGLEWEPCASCGYTFPRVRGPVSRWGRDFLKVRGARVEMADLVASVRDTPGVHAFQVVVEKEDPGDVASRDLLRVTVNLSEGADPATVTARIRREVKEATEVTPDDVIVNDDREGLTRAIFARTGIKADYVIDRRAAPVPDAARGGEG